MSSDHQKPPLDHLSVPYKTVQVTHHFVGVILADVGLYPHRPFYLRATTISFAGRGRKSLTLSPWKYSGSTILPHRSDNMTHDTGL
jgi:hypothetical protein